MILKQLAFCLILCALASLSGRLLGARQSWRRGLLTAFAGFVTSAIFLWYIRPERTGPPGTAYERAVIPFALLVTMGILVLQEFLVHHDPSAPAQRRLGVPRPLRAA